MKKKILFYDRLQLWTNCIMLTQACFLSCYDKLVQTRNWIWHTMDQRWSRGHKVHGQGHKKISRPRPRTDPLEAKAKAKDQGHRHKSSQKKKGPQNCFSGDLKKRRSSKLFFSRKRSSKIFFQAISTWENQEKVFTDFPQGFWRFPTKFQRFKNSVVLEPSTGQFMRTWGF